ncbi:MAG TPA: hypothetical protein V6D22_24550 [Candidatus Obscuribacterales bacterium]
MMLPCLRSFKRGFAVACTALLSMQPLAAVAQVASNYNLVSKQHTITATNVQPVTINVGSKPQVVTQGALLTPAEMVAVQQILDIGRQTIRIGAGGDAIGGRLNITTDIGTSMSGLALPSGVTALANFAGTGTINVANALTNSGRLFGYSSNSLVTNGTFAASNIYNLKGALISSLIPTNLLGLTGTVSPLSISLNASNRLVNAGTITSAADINLASPNITNSGLVSTTSGNINVSSPTAGDIFLKNTGGTLSAINGAINFNNAGYAGSGNLTLVGGNFLSQSLNLNDGTGTVKMNVGQVSGIVNTYAGCAHVGANTPDLHMGVFDVSGDPFVWNNGGNLDLGATITGPLNYLVASAAGSIYTSVSNQAIDTSGSGGNVVLAAGVIASDSTGGVTSPTNSGSISTGTGTITFTRSNVGGDIVLKSGLTIGGNATQNVVDITTGGGKVTLIAVSADNTGASGGHIFMPSTINTIGSGSVGDVTVIGESSDTNGAISLATVKGNNVTVKNATPNLSATVSDATGAITGDFGSGAVLQQGTVTVNSTNSTATGTLTVATAGTAEFSGINSAVGSNVTASVVHMDGGAQLNATSDLSISSPTVGTNANTLTIVGDDGGEESFNTTNGSITIGDSTRTTAVTLESNGSTGTTFDLNGANSVTIETKQSASESITVAAGTVLQTNVVGTGGWTIASPTVSFGDGAGIQNSLTTAGTQIHTNALNLGDGSSSDANTVAIRSSGFVVDDAGQPAAGVTITIATPSTIDVLPVNGTVQFSATQTASSSLTITASNPPTEGLGLSAPGGILFNALNQISFQTGIYNHNGVPATWVATAPIIHVGGAIGISSGADASMTIHTNNLKFDNDGGISAENINVDDAGFTSNSGLTVTLADSASASMTTLDGTGQITFSAQNGTTDNLTFTTPTNAGGLLSLHVDSSGQVSFTANHTISIGPGFIVDNSSSSGNWIAMAPSVTIADGGRLGNNAISPATADLTIHTNALTMGDNSTGNQSSIFADTVTIDDVGMATGGLTITILALSNPESITASGTLTVNATQPLSNLHFNGASGKSLLLDGATAVNIFAPNTVNIQMSIGNSTAAGAWSITAPTLSMNDGAQIDASAGLVSGSALATLGIHAASVVLGNSTTHQTVVISGGTVSLDDGTASTGPTITTNAPVKLAARGSSGLLTVWDGTSITNSNHYSWTLSGATVDIADGANINVLGPLNVHTNQLNIGAGTNQTNLIGTTISIDDATGLLVTGLQVSGATGVLGDNNTTTVNLATDSGIGDISVNIQSISGTVNIDMSTHSAPFGTTTVTTSDITKQLTIGTIAWPGTFPAVQTSKVTIQGADFVELTQSLQSNGGSLEVDGPDVFSSGSPNIDTSNSIGNGGNVTLNATFGSVVFPGTITASGGTNGTSPGSGGTITINSMAPVTLAIGGSVGLNGTGVLTSKGGTAGGDGGSVVLTNEGSISATGGVAIIGGGIDVSSSEGKGGGITITAPLGPVAISNIAVNAAGTSAHQGGTISIDAQSLISQNNGTGITLSAQGVNGGGGGSVSVKVESGDLYVGNPAWSARNIEIITNDGSQTASSAGTVSLQATTGSINLQPFFLKASAGASGAGANFTLNAQNNFFVQGNLSADGGGTGPTQGQAGSIAITVGGTSPFVVGFAGSNGILGSLTARGGSDGLGISITAPNTDVQLNDQSFVVEAAGPITFTLPNGTLTNNSTIQYTGSTAPITSIIVDGQGGNLSLAGSGTLSPGAFNTVLFKTNASGSINFLSGFSQTLPNAAGVTINSPSIVSADNSPNVIITGTSNPLFQIQSPTGSIGFVANSTNGALTFSGGGAVNVTANNLSVGAGFTLSTDGNLNVTAPSSNLTLSGGSVGLPGILTATGANHNVTISGTTSITLSNGTNLQLNASNSTELSSPIIQIGSPSDSGLVSATLSSTNSPAISFDDPGASVSVTHNGSGALLSIQGTQFVIGGNNGTITTPSGLTISCDNNILINAAADETINSNVLSTNGNIRLESHLGIMTVGARAIIGTANGSTLVQSDDTSNGSISIGQNARLFASQGTVSVQIGSVAGGSGARPKNVKVIASHSGLVSFGADSITATAPTNTIVANGEDVFFATNGLAASHITLGGGVSISASKAPMVTSLDLTNPAVTSAIKADQNSKVFGGSLILQNGVAVGGTLILSPATLFPLLSAEYIPQGVTLTLSGFTNSTPIFIAPNANNVQIMGAEKIAGSATINIASKLNVTSTGSISSTSGLTITTVGGMLLSGAVTAKTINLTDTLDTNGNSVISIDSTGVVGKTGSQITATVSGNGEINGQGPNSFIGSIVRLNIEDGSVTVGTKVLQLFVSDQGSGNGSATITNTGNLTLNTSSVGQGLTLIDIGALKVVGAITSASNDVALLGTNSVTVSPNVAITGAEVLINSGNVAAAGKGKIVLGTRDTIDANQVFITLGTPIPQNIAGIEPANVTVNRTGSGQIFYGPSGFTALIAKNTPNVVLNIGNGGMTFNTGAASAKSIVIGAGSVISAVSNTSTESGIDDVVINADEDAAEFAPLLCNGGR